MGIKRSIGPPSEHSLCVSRTNMLTYGWLLMLHSVRIKQESKTTHSQIYIPVRVTHKSLVSWSPVMINKDDS